MASITTPAAVTVGTTATLISDGHSAGSGSTVVVANVGAVTVFLGGPTVTAATGIPLASEEKMVFTLRPGQVLHGITASGTSEVREMVVLD